MLKLFMYSAWNQENVTNEVVAIPFFFLKMQRFAIYPLESLEYATLVDQMLQLALKLRRRHFNNGRSDGARLDMGRLLQDQ